MASERFQDFKSIDNFDERTSYRNCIRHLYLASTIAMTATIPNSIQGSSSVTANGSSLPKQSRLGAGGKELPELYK
jgi:hypothetical protein